MSNVRPHMKTAIGSALSLRTPRPVRRRVSLRGVRQRGVRSTCILLLHPIRATTRQLARHSVLPQSRCRFRAEGGYALCRLAVRASHGSNGQFIVGAPRHSAAPGSQSIDAAGYGSILSLCCYSSPVASKVQLHAFQSKASCPRVRPNPSIERTRTGRPRNTCSSFSAPRGLPARAAHVKR